MPLQWIACIVVGRSRKGDPWDQADPPALRRKYLGGSAGASKELAKKVLALAGGGRQAPGDGDLCQQVPDGR